MPSLTLENVFSMWKNLVIRGAARNENELKTMIVEKFHLIRSDSCSAFYRKILRYIVFSERERRPYTETG